MESLPLKFPKSSNKSTCCFLFPTMTIHLTESHRSGTANKILEAKEKERAKAKEPPKKKSRRCVIVPYTLLDYLFIHMFYNRRSGSPSSSDSNSDSDSSDSSDSDSDSNSDSSDSDSSSSSSGSSSRSRDRKRRRLRRSESHDSDRRRRSPSSGR